MCLYIKLIVILTPKYHSYVSRTLLFYFLSYLFGGLFNWGGAISVAIYYYLEKPPQLIKQSLLIQGWHYRIRTFQKMVINPEAA